MAESSEQRLCLVEPRLCLHLAGKRPHQYLAGQRMHPHLAEKCSHQCWAYPSLPEVTKLLPREDNLGILFILNAMFSMLPVILTELRKLQAPLQAFGVKIEARWWPSEVN